jgi:ABC-type branched-subunit amino acid transport system substrate-binding protein
MVPDPGHRSTASAPADANTHSSDSIAPCDLGKRPVEVIHATSYRAHGSKERKGRSPMTYRADARTIDRSARPRRPRKPGAAVAVLATVAVAALVSGCDASNASSDVEGGRTDKGLVRLYGSDGNMSNGFGKTFKDEPGILSGMKGTTPLSPVPEDFKRRVKTVDSQLIDYLYAGEAYDAVLISALAAETARSTDGPQIAKYMTAVTVGKGPNSICESAKQCLDAIRAGRDVAYRGLSMRRSGFTDRGEPTTASYGTLNFSKDNRIDDNKTEYVGAGDEKTEAKELPAPPAAPARGLKPPLPLKIGALLPHTGDLAIAGPPIFAAVQLAVRELNEAGGVLGQPVQYFDGDDGTDPKVASATVDKHIAAGVQVIIGAAASGITKAVLPKVVAAGRVLISPSATSDELTTIDDKGFFFRTSPPDVLQAKALVDVIMRFGAQRVVVVAREDSYGTGLRNRVGEELKAAGIKPERIKLMSYQVRESYDVGLFGEIATATTGFKPDAVLVIGFEESSNVIKALSAKGMKFHD